jgi:hypothetical protein
MKESNNKGWEDRIKSRLQHFEESPDSEIWAEIEKNIQPERKWPLKLVAVLLLLLIGAWISFSQLKINLGDEQHNDITVQNNRAPLAGAHEKIEKNKPEEKENNSPGNHQNSEAYDKNNYTADTSINSEPSKTKRTSTFYTKEKKENYQNPEEAAMASPGSPTHAQSKQPDIDLYQPKKGTGKEMLFSLASVKPSWPDEEFIYILPIHLAQEPENEEHLRPEEKSGKKRKQRKPTIEIWSTLNPMLTYRQVKPNLLDEVQILALEDNEAFSLNRLGLQTSIGFSYFMNRNFAFKAGAFYRFTQNKWSYAYLGGKPDSLIVDQLDENSISTQPVFSQKTETVSINQHYLGALLGVQFMSKGFIRRTVNLELQISKDPAYHKMLYFLAFDVDLEKPLYSRFYLNAGPSFIWGLNDFTPQESQHFEMKPYSLGFKLGVSYKLYK